MKLLRLEAIRNLSKGKIWLKKESYEILNNITEKMLIEMIETIETIHKENGLKKAKAEEIQNAHNQYRLNMEAKATTELIDELITMLEKKKQRADNYYVHG